MINFTISAAINMFASKLEFVRTMDKSTLNFVKAYVFGTKKSPGLSAYEQRLTRTQIVKNIVREHTISDDGLFGWAETTQSANIPGIDIHDYFQHPTAGKVGGFTFTLDMSGDKVIANCYDRWDFNNAQYDIELPIPKSLWEPAKALAKLVGITLYKVTEDTATHSTECLYVTEEDLAKFNESHSFETRWTVELPALFCRIDSPYIGEDKYSRFAHNEDYDQYGDVDFDYE